MVTKKQARANERKRQEQLARKHAEQRARTQGQWRATGAVAAAVVLVVALVGVVAVLAGQDDPTPVATPSPTASGTPDSLPAPDPTIAAGREWAMTLDTNHGPITIALDGEAAPQAAATLIHLSRTGFFNQTDCHRLTTQGIYVLQCGDPEGTGMGGPPFRWGPIENAPADNVYPAGTVAMARVSGDGNSMGSQFFIVYEDSTIPSDAAGGYTVVGTVSDGLGIVEGVASAGTITGQPDGRPATSVIINEVTVE